MVLIVGVNLSVKFRCDGARLSLSPPSPLPPSRDHSQAESADLVQPAGLSNARVLPAMRDMIPFMQITTTTEINSYLVHYIIQVVVFDR